MGDVYKEQIVKRQQTSRDSLKRAGLIMAVIFISFIAFSMIPQFAPFVVTGAVFGAWYLLSFLKVEYEYTFTSGELDIDAIYNRSRRKRVFSARVSDFEIMAHVDDKMHHGSFEGAQTFRDYSSGVTSDNSYAFLINHENKRTKVVIEPNEIMLVALAGVLTRRKLHVKR
ncbi:MAG: DUF6106 family protein [Defluviitaleaceae bacterium]|nr:DUF6106 family protein [Defluviitaleaceae bacterium]